MSHSQETATRHAHIWWLLNSLTERFWLQDSQKPVISWKIKLFYEEEKFTLGTHFFYIDKNLLKGAASLVQQKIVVSLIGTVWSPATKISAKLFLSEGHSPWTDLPSGFSRVSFTFLLRHSSEER